VWKDAIQSKYKKARPSQGDLLDEVQRNREKYSRATSGRPVRKKQIELAKRDATKQVSFFSTKYSLPFQIIDHSQRDDKHR